MILIEWFCKSVIMLVTSVAGGILGFYLAYEMAIHGWLD